MNLSRVLTVATLIALLASPALAREVIVMNGTGFTIKALGLSDSNDKSDAQDLLGNDTLAAGEGIKIDLQGDPKGWDLIAQDNEGNQVNWNNLDLTGVSKITIKADGTAEME